MVDDYTDEELDEELVESYAQEMAFVAFHRRCVGDVALAGAYLAEELAELHERCAGTLIDAASARAGALVDGSELDSGEFVTAMRRLAELKQRTLMTLSLAQVV